MSYDRDDWSVAFRHRLQVKLRSGRHVRRHLDGQAEREIPGLRDEEFVRTFRHPHLRYATLVGDGLVRVHHHTSTPEGRLTDFVDRLDRHPVLGMADDYDSKTDGAFRVRDPDIRSRALDAPRIEALPRRGFQFDLRNK